MKIFIASLIGCILISNLLIAQDPKTVTMKATRQPTDSNILIVLNNKVVGTIRDIKNLDTIVKV